VFEGAGVGGGAGRLYCGLGLDLFGLNVGGTIFLPAHHFVIFPQFSIDTITKIININRNGNEIRKFLTPSSILLYIIGGKKNMSTKFSVCVNKVMKNLRT
jgi:hypothetical protein